MSEAKNAATIRIKANHFSKKYIFGGNEMLWHDICLGIAALVLALVFVPLAMKLAYKIGAVDKPNARKVHTKIMPRMGGLGIYLAYIIVVLATQKMNMQLAGLLLGSTILVVLGIFDDMKDLNAKFKLLIQILAAVIVMAFGVRIEFMTNVFGGEAIYLDILSLPITLLWIVGITNAINLIDGLDGLAGGIATIAALSMAVVGWIYGQYLMASMAIILAGATMGFLRYNFHPAKVFMGDTGSLFLGFNLSVLAIMGVAKSVTFISLAAPVLVLGVPIFDTFFAILRRKMNHKPIFAADKDHLHHRLLGMGFSHRKTVLIIYAISFFLALSAILITYLSTAEAVAVVAIVLSVILIGAGKLGVIAVKRPRECKNTEEIKQNKEA